MPTTRTTCKQPALPYPDLGSQDTPGFWLRNWACDIARLDAITTHIRSISNKASRPLLYALYQARRVTRSDLDTSLNYVKEDGHLLYAWVGTTALDVGVPA